MKVPPKGYVPILGVSGVAIGNQQNGMSGDLRSSIPRERDARPVIQTPHDEVAVGALAKPVTQPIA
jgi:hypothetical protein